MKFFLRPNLNLKNKGVSQSHKIYFLNIEAYFVSRPTLAVTQIQNSPHPA